MDGARAVKVLRRARCFRSRSSFNLILPAIRPTSTQSRLSSSSTNPANESPSGEHANQPINILSEERREFLDRALRVNQAGELAATLIYTAQTPPIVNSYPHLRPLMKHMYVQEAGHFSTFNKLLAKHRVRPTAMYPVWQATATLLGWSTGMMGREAAMACTEAVETEIGNHYNNQVRELLKWMQESKAEGKILDPELRELMDTIRRIRDEELEHLDHAVENDAKEARPYEAFTNIIRYGCRGAIWLSERI